MTRCQFQRSPAESSAARTPWLLHRLRDAAAFARRSAHRKEDAAIDTVPAIEDQLRTLWPICSAQRVSTGITCGAPAVAVAEIHAIDGCDQMGLSPDGDLVETLCQACLATVQRAMATYVGDKREMASHAAPNRCAAPAGVPLDTCAVSSPCARSGQSDWHHDPTTHRLPVCGCGGR
jgi:hypothetical protein